MNLDTHLLTHQEVLQRLRMGKDKFKTVMAKDARMRPVGTKPEFPGNRWKPSQLERFISTIVARRLA